MVEVVLPKYAPVQDRKYQDIGVKFLVEKKRAILADKMGLGKTIQIVRAAVQFNMMSWLIICPKKAMLNHIKELNRILPQGHRYLDYVIISGTATQREQLWKKVTEAQERFVMINRQSLQRDVERGIVPDMWDLITYDEAHWLRNRKTKNFLTMKYFKSKGLFLYTGSIVRKGPEQLWTYLHLIDRKRFSSYWRFVNTYCVVLEDGQFGREIVGVKNLAGLKSMLDQYMIRRTKADVAPELPPKQRDILPAVMTVDQARIYKELSDDLIAKLRSDVGTEDYTIASNKLTAFMRLRQLLVTPKILNPLLDDGGGLDVIIEHMEDSDVDDQHCVIFTPFAKAVPYIKARLQKEGYTNIITLQGGDADDLKVLEQRLEIFRQTKGQCICTIPFAESFDLETAKIGYFLGYEWNQELNYQAEDRLDRMNDKFPRNFYYVKHEGTIEDRILEVLDENVNIVQTYMKNKQMTIDLLQDTKES